MLDDSELSNLTGQAGLTIDLSNFSPVSGFEYAEPHLLTMPGIEIGGHGSGVASDKPFYTNQLDNLRVNLSVADNSIEHSEDGYSFGFSDWREIAKAYLAGGNETSIQEFQALAKGVDATRGQLLVDDKKVYDEGDLIVHLAYLDPWEKDGGFESYLEGQGLSGKSLQNASYQEAESLVSRSVDFKYSINEIDLAYGSNLLGAATLPSVRSLGDFQNGQGGQGESADHKTTRMMSDFSVEGYLGPHDLHIKTFDGNEQNNPAQSKDTGITWNSYFRITDLDVYLDLKGMQISNLQVHNDRGDLSGLNLNTHDNSVGNSSFGFAHAEREIYSIEESYIDPLKESAADGSPNGKKKKAILFNTRFKGDIDIEHVSFGDTGRSIGSFYITDMYFEHRLKITAR